MNAAQQANRYEIIRTMRNYPHHAIFKTVCRGCGKEWDHSSCSEFFRGPFFLFFLYSSYSSCPVVKALKAQPRSERNKNNGRRKKPGQSRQPRQPGQSVFATIGKRAKMPVRGSTVRLPHDL
jgi:hypothetical protein